MTSSLDLFRNVFLHRNNGRPPVWLMRQAGRYLAEYRALRARHAFLEMCESPDLAVEVSLLPVEAFDVDAVIVFSDILIPLRAMGAPLDFGEEGPVFREPVRDDAALDRLGDLDPATGTPAILETIRRVAERVGGEKAVLGFAGAPFTLASYLIEGRVGSRGVDTLMRTLYGKPDFLRRLLERLASMTADYLEAQLDAGATAVQLFDTWAGRLGANEYREFALPYHRQVFERLSSRFPDARTILFVRDGAHLVEAMAESGARGLSLDWRVSLKAARAAVGDDIVLQGNLDPAALFAPAEDVRARVRAILEDRRGDPAFIFNLGHGVTPETPVESVRALVETVKSFG